jgi:hypothetical protein
MASMVNKFSDFDVCKAFKHKDKALLLKYIELVYSKESQLNSIQNLNERKVEACVKAGLDPADAQMIAIMDMKDPEMNNLIFHFQSYFQSSIDHQQYMTDLQTFLDLQKVLMTPISFTDEDVEAKYKKRDSLLAISDNLRQRINRLRAELYSVDTKDMADLKVRQLLSPEQRIKMMKSSNV